MIEIQTSIPSLLQEMLARSAVVRCSTPMHITQETVAEFKNQHCDENLRIANLLRHEFADQMASPILDVGCGLGDIAAIALRNNEVVLLDRLPYPTTSDNPLHQRVTIDFFEFSPDRKFNTILFSHVLQFLDFDPERLVQRTAQLAPANVVTVLNANTGFMSILLDWWNGNLPTANPEMSIPGFLDNYTVARKAALTANIVCPSFEILARQVCYLYDTVLEGEDLSRLIRFLTLKLPRPAFDIEEWITLYKADDHG
jgi:hypothetical protein